VANDTEGAAPLSPADSMKTIVVPPGYRVELVAAEPLVQDPILIDFDADGRMWVVEMPAFAIDESMTDSRDELCRVVVLEDTDDDGDMDRRTVFVDGLVLPRAIKTLDGGVLVGEPPHLWLMRDTDGDLRMDTRELVADTYGRRDGNPEHNANSLIWGLDNWLYTSEHDWHLRFRRGGFEVVPTLPRGQWGGTIDDAGRVYRNFNNAPLHVDLLPARYYTRNPDLARTRGLYEPLVGLEDAVAWPIRPTRGVNRGYRDQFFREDGSSIILQSAATPVVYRGDRLPSALQGGVFVTDSTTNLVHWFAIEDDGTGRLSAHDGFERGEIFASSDERLRPVSAASAPDGTLYVVDMYRGVVQDVAYQTEYLQDYIRRNRLTGPVHLGRIWRLVHETTVREPRPALSGRTPAELVPYLSHANGWWRDTAQQLLVQRGDRSVVPALVELALHGADWRAKLHALGTLAGLSALEPSTLGPLLHDPAPDVRAWAVRWAEPWLSEPGHPLAPAVLALLDDPSWTVRRQLAASVGELPAKERTEAAIRILERYAQDPVVVDATVSGLSGLEAGVLDALLRPHRSPEARDAVSMLSAAMARSREPDTVLGLIGRAAAPERTDVERDALLAGLELGLGRTRGGRPGRPGPAPRPVTLPAEPAWLLRLAGGETGLSELARSVSNRLTWPGRPSLAPRVEPLTADEQRRFEQGKVLYSTFCVACHQPDGRGSDRLAPSLVGSPLATGAVGIATRVVLGGKEGDIGLMPPLTTLDDGQIAAVLTYVRREWGNGASPVAPDDVREIRGLTRLRDRPWTDEDLRGEEP